MARAILGFTTAGAFLAVFFVLALLAFASAPSTLAFGRAGRRAGAAVIRAFTSH